MSSWKSMWLAAGTLTLMITFDPSMVPWMRSTLPYTEDGTQAGRLLEGAAGPLGWSSYSYFGRLKSDVQH